VRASAIYLVVLLLAGVWVIGRSALLYRPAAALLPLAAAVHATGILFDMMLQGTWPITNLYSGISLGGWILVLLGTLLEHRHRSGVALGGAAIAGLVSLVAAHAIVPGGALALVVNILDGPFWLACGLLTAACLGAHWPASATNLLRASPRQRPAENRS
jgi:hypothetical protein